MFLFLDVSVKSLTRFTTFSIDFVYALRQIDFTVFVPFPSLRISILPSDVREPITPVMNLDIEY